MGIDPGTNILGFGVIRIDAKGPHYVTMGVFDLRKIKDPFEKLANINAGVKELIAELFRNNSGRVLITILITSL